MYLGPVMSLMSGLIWAELNLPIWLMKKEKRETLKLYTNFTRFFDHLCFAESRKKSRRTCHLRLKYTLQLVSLSSKSRFIGSFSRNPPLKRAPQSLSIRTLSFNWERLLIIHTFSMGKSQMVPMSLVNILFRPVERWYSLTNFFSKLRKTRVKSWFSRDSLLCLISSKTTVFLENISTAGLMVTQISMSVKDLLRNSPRRIRRNSSSWSQLGQVA